MLIFQRIKYLSNAYICITDTFGVMSLYSISNQVELPVDVLSKCRVVRGDVEKKAYYLTCALSPRSQARSTRSKEQKKGSNGLKIFNHDSIFGLNGYSAVQEHPSDE